MKMRGICWKIRICVIGWNRRIKILRKEKGINSGDSKVVIE